MMWFQNYTVDTLNGFRNANMGEHLGIEFTDIGDDYLCATMPVDHRTVQPFGRLHGGASSVLAETLGSVAAWMCIDPDKKAAVGLDINANHIRTAWEGKGDVVGTCTPLHIGRTTHVWQIDITHAQTGKRVCISRITMAIIDKP
jgi:1,4-dihydroxy-2-naphthoyl-CoA hydrolase